MFMKPVRIHITDTLDLHTFKPEEVGDLLEEYLECCREKNLLEVRIIHGKGTGVLKNRVISHLKKNPRVVRFTDAPMEAGGWGATLVTLDGKEK